MTMWSVKHAGSYHSRCYTQRISVMGAIADDLPDMVGRCHAVSYNYYGDIKDFWWGLTSNNRQMTLTVAVQTMTINWLRLSDKLFFRAHLFEFLP